MIFHCLIGIFFKSIGNRIEIKNCLKPRTIFHSFQWEFQTNEDKNKDGKNNKMQPTNPHALAPFNRHPQLQADLAQSASVMQSFWNALFFIHANHHGCEASSCDLSLTFIIDRAVSTLLQRYSPRAPHSIQFWESLPELPATCISVGLNCLIRM